MQSKIGPFMPHFGALPQGRATEMFVNYIIFLHHHLNDIAILFFDGQSET